MRIRKSLFLSHPPTVKFKSTRQQNKIKDNRDIAY